MAKRAYSYPGGRKPQCTKGFPWLVLAGDDAAEAGMVYGPTRPSEEKVRGLLGLEPNLPILVGMP